MGFRTQRSFKYQSSRIPASCIKFLPPPPSRWGKMKVLPAPQVDVSGYVAALKAMFTLHRFHFDPFLLPKTELFSSLFTLLHFQTETNIYQLVFTLFLKNASVFLFLTTRPQGFWYWRFQIVPFLVFTLELRFCLAPFSFSSVFIIVFI